MTPDNAPLVLAGVLGVRLRDRCTYMPAIVAANYRLAGIDALRFAPPPAPDPPPGAAALQLIDGLLALDDALAEARREALAAMPA